MLINFISGLTRTLAPDTGGAIGGTAGTGENSAAASAGTATQTSSAAVSTSSPEPMDLTSRLMSIFNAPETGAGNNVDTSATQPFNTEGQPTQGQIQTPPVEQPLLLGRFKSTDDLANAYRSLEGEYTRKGQELTQMRNMVTQFESMTQQAAMPQENNQQVPENREALKEKLLERFYEDPVGVFEEMQRSAVEQATQTINKTIAPINDAFQAQQEAAEVNRRAMEFAQDPANAGWQEFQGEMQQILETYPEMKKDPNVFQKAFIMAKGLRFKPQDINSMLQDPNVVQQLSSNEMLRNNIINSHLTQVNSVNTAFPPTIGAQGGASFAPPPNKPKSFDEARELTMGLFGRK